MSLVAIIGGSGLTKLKNLEIVRRLVVRTPYGEPSGPLLFGRIGKTDVVFLARHGHGHTIPPHQVNYRANIWALHSVGARQIVAVAAVGGIRGAMQPGVIACPDQLIDYTYGRGYTFFEGGDKQVVHIDFTYPYCERLRTAYQTSAQKIKEKLVMQGVYAATQGPRLETAAEVRRLERDGADMVGMTGSPEAQLAREMNICYASLCLVVNLAAGKSTGMIDLASLQEIMGQGMGRIRSLLESIVPDLSAYEGSCACCGLDSRQVMGDGANTAEMPSMDDFAAGDVGIPN